MNRLRNVHFVCTNGIERSLQSGYWYVANFDGVYGSSDEYNRFYSDRGRNADLVGDSNNVVCGIHNSMAIQLLASKEIRRGLSLKR